MSEDTAEATSSTRVLRLSPCATVDEAASRLAAGLAERRASLSTHRAGFFRLEVPVGAAAPLPWLVSRPHPARLYFETPDHDLSLAGLGVARTWSGGIGEVEILVHRLARDPAAAPLRFLLTHRFDGAPAAASPWAAFGQTRIVLPLVELRRAPGPATLAVNVDLEATDTPARIDEGLELLARRATAGPKDAGFRTIGIADEPDEGAWDRAVRETLDDIGAGRMAKCVLARTRSYAIDGSLDPFVLLRRAAEAQPDTFRFGVQVSAVRAFVGTTPEVLFRRSGIRVESEALAGTRRRDDDPIRDERMGAELLGSEKDLAEQAFVRQHVEDVLATLCHGPLQVEGPRLRRLAGLQHLDTRVRGRLAAGSSDADLLNRLHPTPAVCGVPTPVARAAIATREPFDRGLYAGAVGILGRDQAVVTVGIRSALHLGDRVTLWAGAGLVEGSEPEAEWQETGDKMRVLDAILQAGRIA